MNDTVRHVRVGRDGKETVTTRTLTDEEQTRVDRMALLEAFPDIASPTLEQTSEALKALIKRELNGS